MSKRINVKHIPTVVCNVTQNKSTDMICPYITQQSTMCITKHVYNDDGTISGEAWGRTDSTEPSPCMKSSCGAWDRKHGQCGYKKVNP